MTASISTKRSTANIIFEQLRDQIMALDILPGTKLSEAEVAARFGVSRQPVREAFNLLENLDLLVIRPQKASRVRAFSLSQIGTARFARLAIELEVTRAAARNWSDVYRPGVERCLDAQDRALADCDTGAFHKLDEDFHRLIAEVARVPFAFDLIRQYKSHVDRICVLSLKQASEMADLIGDHRRIFDCVTRGDIALLDTTLRLHLSRIEGTIDAVREKHPNHFEA